MVDLYNQRTFRSSPTISEKKKAIRFQVFLAAARISFAIVILQ